MSMLKTDNLKIVLVICLASTFIFGDTVIKYITSDKIFSGKEISEQVVNGGETIKNRPLTQDYSCSRDLKHDWLNNPENKNIINNETKIIFYNRVPKCGSKLTRIIFRALRKQNDFEYINDNGRHNHPTKNGTIGDHNIFERVINPITKAKGKSLLIGHIFYINLNDRSDVEMPLYINLIRDPVSRMISYYNFIRFRKKLRRMDREEKYRSFDDCVTMNIPECTDQKYINMIVPYFCGQDKICQTPSYKSLQRAKQNVLRYYSVVGYMERLEDFIQALEFMIPSFFKGAFRTYENVTNAVYEGQAQTYAFPSNETIFEMKLRIPLEYDFYYFIRHRFDCFMQKMKAVKQNK